MNITVIGLGYVGLANSLLLAEHHTVTGVDLNNDRIKQLRSGISPLRDPEIEDYLTHNLAQWSTSLDSVQGSSLLIICTPTDFNETTRAFDTSSIERVARDALARNKDIHILIKSTIPVGYVKKLRRELQTERIAFSPEFLREGKALYDNLYPSRIVIGETTTWAREIAQIFKDAALNSPDTLTVSPDEAEAIKLFSNTYLAMRVAFFNELDTYALVNNLSTKEIINGVSLDPRVGQHYNNPSFGYGGYCLPKDTKEVESLFEGIPQNLISAIVTSNQTRKDFITDDILHRNPTVVGIYRLTMKNNSDNFRKSAIEDIVKKLGESDVRVIVYEPASNETSYMNYPLINDLEKFAQGSDVILANRLAPELEPYRSKVYSRDIFNEN